MFYQSVDIHMDKPLKCRQLILDSSTGKFKYQIKQLSGKYIACVSFNESILIQASSDCSPFRQRQKNDCTCRIRQNLHGKSAETSEEQEKQEYFNI